jgi:hypothetical protein
MEKTEYSNKIANTISNQKDKLKKNELEYAFCKMIDSNGESCKNKASTIQKRKKEIECLEQFTKLPDIFYYKFASNDKIREVLNEELDEFKEKIKKLKASIEADYSSIKVKSKRQKDLAVEYNKLAEGTNPNAEGIVSEAASLNGEIKELKNVISKKENDLKGLIYYYETIVDMTDDEYRAFIINGIKGSEELLKKAEQLKTNINSYKLFSRAASFPGRTKQLSELLIKLKKAALDKPDPIYYDVNKLNYDVNRLFYEAGELKIPSLLFHKVFGNNEKSYNSITGEVKDPVAVLNAITEFINTYNEQCETYEAFRHEYNYLGEALDFVDLYNKSCADHNNEQIKYGDPKNTPQQNSILNYFTTNRLKRIVFNYEKGVNVDEAELIDRRFDIYNDSLIFSKKKRRESLSPLVEGQIKIFNQKLDYLKGELEKLTHLPVKHFFDVDFYDKEFHIGIDSLVDEHKKALIDLEKTFKELVEEYNRRVAACNKNVLKVVQEILNLTNCEEYDLEQLLKVKDIDEKNIETMIYENAALYDAALLIIDLENAAKQISLDEEAKLNGMTLGELAVRKLSDQRDMYTRMLEEQRTKNQESSAKLPTSESTNEKPAKIKKLKTKADFLADLQVYIDEDIDD